ncbi:RecQ family zinc-binding domain-containing protein [Sinobaca sp. H24]|uniref:RecQ family zinc-binding domain-containing protein n=1 Tax=Sinobaca sp. H24 TaxID=2923376 RepID=UPI0035B043C5
MEKWLQEEACRRRALLDYFGEILKEKPEQCCDLCGADWVVPALNQGRKKDEIFEISWKKRLEELLTASTSRSEKGEKD